MCGIVGLFLKDRVARARARRHAGRACSARMCERGPDSAGFAVYGSGRREPVQAHARRARRHGFRRALPAKLGDAHRRADHGRDQHATPMPSWHRRQRGRAAERLARARGARASRSWAPARAWRSTRRWACPDEVAERFGLAHMAGTHGIGHTRMATEVGGHDRRRASVLDRARTSAWCITARCPTTTISAASSTREGMTFETDNDTEVAAGYLTWRMSEGASLGEALESGLDDLDGFYTFVVGTRDRLRRAARSDRLQARGAWPRPTTTSPSAPNIARSPDLPGIDKARVWEPEPADGLFLGALTVPRHDRPSILHTARCATQPGACTTCRRTPTRRTGAIAQSARAPCHRRRPRRADRRSRSTAIVGYYCAGMNKEATVIDQRPARRRASPRT